MNRQQFLAELSQYLTFFSPEEKTKIISAYNEKFDSAGPECEAAVLAELGTPMMTAIDLKRRVEAGEKISFGEEVSCEETADETPSELSVETETEATLESENTEASDEPSDHSETENEPPETLPEAVAEKRKPRGAKLVFALIGASLLSLVIAALFLTIASVGIGAFTAMSYLMIAGLNNLLYLTDALMLFGGGLVLFALGLIVVWFAIWSAVSLISKLFRGACKKGSAASEKE